MQIARCRMSRQGPASSSRNLPKLGQSDPARYLVRNDTSITVSMQIDYATRLSTNENKIKPPWLTQELPDVDQSSLYPLPRLHREESATQCTRCVKRNTYHHRA